MLKLTDNQQDVNREESRDNDRYDDRSVEEVLATKLCISCMCAWMGRRTKFKCEEVVVLHKVVWPAFYKR